MKGSQLTKEQTRFIFETNTLGKTSENTSIDDILETIHHFRCIDYIIDHASDKITEPHIKHLHFILKDGTSDSQKKWLHDGLSIKMCTLVNESVKEPLETGIIMQLWNGSPAGTAPKFRLRNR